ncbi:MAG: BrnT family toxin [Rhodospirillaceae bacterium]|nr:BrnT family toxin [Rhodospirillaceae bacterium]
MDFEWDETKSQRTRAKRGIDFNFALLVFDDPHRIDRPDERKPYGEDRRQTIGLIGDDVYFVVYTMRGKRTRIISARKAHDNEEEDYRTTLGATSVD